MSGIFCVICKSCLESVEAEPRLLWDHSQLSCKICCVRTKAIWAYVWCFGKIAQVNFDKRLLPDANPSELCVNLKEGEKNCIVLNPFLRFCHFQTWDPWNVPFALSCALRVFRLLSQVTLLRFASVAHISALLTPFFIQAQTSLDLFRHPPHRSAV